MTEYERITVLETKVESLEKRMTKLESSEENKAQAYSSIDTKLQLLGQKFDAFVEFLEKSDNNKKFNWSQIFIALGIVVAMGTTIWATNYTVRQTVKASTGVVQLLSTEDLDLISQTVLDTIEKNNENFY